MAQAVVDIERAQRSPGTRTPSQALTTSGLYDILEDIRWQPAWRYEADKAVDYYDGNQIDPDTMAALEAKGMGPLIHNMIAPIINVVLGMEARTRTDWRVSADDDRWQDVAEALSAKVHEVEREAHADRACADAYGGQVKAGIGWVEVSRSHDPFDYPYRVRSVHRREIFWDWLDQEPGLGKSRYKVRKRWFDLDQAKTLFPKDSDVLEGLMGDPERFRMNLVSTGTSLLNAEDVSRALDLEDFEQFRIPGRRRICLYEVWYRVFTRGLVLRMPNGEVAEFDKDNPIHQVLVARGLIIPVQAVYSKLRMSIWAGPHRLFDCGCPKNNDPYVPFWGYREDRTGVPYGLIRAMTSPQDEINARRRKMMWLLSSSRLLMDSDALDETANSVRDVVDELARPDAVVLLNPSRQNRQGAFQVDLNIGLANEQFRIAQDAEISLQKVTGVFNALLGRESSGQSGLAINSLVEQGTIALAEINDNYHFARNAVGNRMLDLIRDDMLGVQVDVVTGESGKRKVISLNMMRTQDGQPVLNAAGQPVVVNDVRQAKVKIALEDVPSSPSYRQQQLTMLAEVMKGLPPQLQAALAPFYMEATDLRKRHEMADAIRKTMGEPDATPEQQAAAQQQKNQIQAQTIMLELQERAAKVEKMKAEAAKIMAGIQKDAQDTSVQQQAADKVRQAEEQANRKIDQLTAQAIALRQKAALSELNARASQLEGQVDPALAQALTQLQQQQMAIVDEFAREMAEIREQIMPTPVNMQAAIEPQTAAVT